MLHFQEQGAPPQGVSSSDDVALLGASLESVQLDNSHCFEGIVTSVGASFAIINHDCYVPRHFVNLLHLQVGQPLHVVAIPHISGRNRWRVKQITPLGNSPNSSTAPHMSHFQQPSAFHAFYDPTMIEQSNPISVVGEVTSSGQGFCIVNNDIFVPVNIFGGKTYDKSSIVRVDIIPRVSGRNKWRAIHIEPAAAGEAVTDNMLPQQSSQHEGPSHEYEMNGYVAPTSSADLSHLGYPKMHPMAMPIQVPGLREGFRHIVGVVTSQGREFCIVNHDVYVPAYLLGGIRRIVEGRTILSLTVCALRAGRNKWRAVEAYEMDRSRMVHAWDPALGMGIPPMGMLPAGVLPGGLGMPSGAGMGPLLPMLPGTESDQQVDMVGTVTSCGTGFCIVNHDVYVPSHLLEGATVQAGMPMRVRVVERHIGRNNWRALSATLQA